MTAVDNTHSSAARSAGSTDHFAVDGVHLSTVQHADATVVGASGELDAANLHHLTSYVRGWITKNRPLVVDLSGLDFLAAQGIRALFAVDDECRRIRSDWAVVPSRPVARLLRICDSDARLPAVASIDEALQRFAAPTEARRLLQLVPESG